ncbi:MAG: T9SS type A sorting domain-containing protein [Bacteroidetes bacterium]|nr:T9SS type A sorting domain-containing protein [Bacteroidota bacterium]
MKIAFTLFCIILSLLSPIVSNSQINATSADQLYTSGEEGLFKGLSKMDSIRLSNIPQLEVPQLYKSPNAVQLPFSVDNSTLMYFRPVTSQSGYECGQIAGQAFVFTYEVNRLRNLSSQIAANQYPSHFSWNFLNGAYNYNGASFFDSWEITRTCGTPNVVDYGGALNTGGEKRWMTGYAKYYNGMKNRLSGVYSIRCDSPEGIRILKTWLYDHLEGSATGGVAAMYAQYCSPPGSFLPAGTPEAGKALVSTWGTSPSHAWTIMGYNDSIRFDYNGDGLYTNNIDINGDGVVDVRDWEIGGFKIINGYSGPGWGNGGFAYMMYKSLADGANYGIWNSSVYVIKAKTTDDPLMTMKINLKHNRRFQIKVIVGVSQNTNATSPDIRMEYPIFNYQGGSIPMQGDTTDIAQNIEFGLDISPLLSYVSSALPSKYFLEVIEKDPTSIGGGQLNSFSVIDYTSGVNETVYPSTNIILTNNDTTRFALTKTVTFNKLDIINDSMNAKIYTPYSHQLNASAGTPPYKWALKMDYSESISNVSFPNAATQVLNTGNSGYVLQNLNFNFPYFGKTYNQIYIYADGYIKFDNSLYTFPYLIDADLLFRSHKMIAAFYADLVYGTGQNVTYETNANSSTIIWKAGVNGQSSSSVNVALKIYSSGKIEIYYGAINLTGNWLSALSGGDVTNYQYATLTNSFTTNTTDKKLILTPPDYPDNMDFTETGLFSATPQRYYNTSIKFRVTDNNNLSSIKSIVFKTYGLLFDYSINAGGDSLVNAGDTVKVTVKLKNIGNTTINNAKFICHSQDTNIMMLDSSAVIGNILANDSVIISNAARFVVKQNVMDGHYIDLLGNVISVTDTFARGLSLRVNSFNLQTGTVTIYDGNNNVLEPNETASLLLQIKNIGAATATNLHLELSTSDPYVSLNPSFANIDTIKAFSSKNAFFIITTAANIPANHLIVLTAKITGSNNYKYITFFYIQLGEVMEDFETNNFTKYNWTLGGNLNWFTSDSLKYQGNYSAKSGKITHSQNSFFAINQYILADGNIKFYKKVSCERDNTNHNYDYLAFYIDGVEKSRWDGEINWSQEIFPVTTGTHTFKWAYVKDNSVNTGADCGWVDNIVFPLFGDAAPNLNYFPLSINKTMFVNTMDTAIVNISNAGNGLVLFTNNLQLNNSLSVPWASTDLIAGGIYKNENQKIVIQFDATQLQPGNYNCQLVVYENFISQRIIPVNLSVLSQIGIDEKTNFTSCCFPNPFGLKTNISINSNEKGKLSVLIYDFTGRLIKDLTTNVVYDKGSYTFSWDGSDNSGNKLADGLYFCNIMLNNKSFTHKLVLSK